jgi:hypothetical protein
VLFWSTCPSCSREFARVKGVLTWFDESFAAFLAEMHWHGGQNEIWFEAIFGELDEDTSPDRVTFGCRLGSVEGQEELACSLLRPKDGDEFGGRRLDRDEALAHPWLERFWEVVDFLVLHEPTIHAHAYGH